MLTKEEILHYLAENKQELKTEFKLTKIGLFGSFGRGEQTQDSDIDLLVEFEPETEALSEKKRRIRERMKKNFPGK
jgi:hypothetical protein